MPNWGMIQQGLEPWVQAAAIRQRALEQDRERKRQDWLDEMQRKQYEAEMDRQRKMQEAAAALQSALRPANQPRAGLPWPTGGALPGGPAPVATAAPPVGEFLRARSVMPSVAPLPGAQGATPPATGFPRLWGSPGAGNAPAPMAGRQAGGGPGLDKLRAAVMAYNMARGGPVDLGDVMGEDMVDLPALAPELAKELGVTKPVPARMLSILTTNLQVKQKQDRLVARDKAIDDYLGRYGATRETATIKQMAEAAAWADAKGLNLYQIAEGGPGYYAGASTPGREYLNYTMPGYYAGQQQLGAQRNQIAAAGMQMEAYRGELSAVNAINNQRMELARLSAKPMTLVQWMERQNALQGTLKDYQGKIASLAKDPMSAWASEDIALLRRQADEAQKTMDWWQTQRPGLETQGQSDIELLPLPQMPQIDLSGVGEMPGPGLMIGGYPIGSGGGMPFAEGTGPLPPLGRPPNWGRVNTGPPAPSERPEIPPAPTPSAPKATGKQVDLASIPGEGWGKDFKRLEAWAIQKHGNAKGKELAAKFRNLRKMTVKDPQTGKTRPVSDEDIIATGKENPDTAEFFAGW